MRYQLLPAAFLVALGLILGCGQGYAAPETAQCVLTNLQGQKVGEAKLEEAANGVNISLKVENLPPGLHAVHIHEKSMCNPPDFASAGGHFNPFGKHHGLKNAEGPHAGDLPNLMVGADGKGAIEVVAGQITLKPGKNSLFQPGGTSLVIHEKADDDMSDPAGNAGPRIACGAIVK